MREEFGHIKPDAPCPDHGNLFANLCFAAQNVDVAQHVFTVLSGDAGIARHNTRGDDYLVKAGQIIRRHAASQLNLDSHFFDHGAVPIDQPPELFFAGDLFGHVELATNLVCFVKQRHRVPALCRGHCRGQPRRPRPDDGHCFKRRRRGDRQLCLIAGAVD